MNYVTVPAVSRKLHRKLLGNMSRAEELSDSSPYNFVSGTQESASWCIICNGVSYNYVSDAVSDLNIEDSVRILRIGFSHPMPRAVITDALIGCEKALVVEEGEPYMENAVRAIVQESGLTLAIRGKGDDSFPRLLEYDPGMVRRRIAGYFGVGDAPAVMPGLADIPEIPQRPPNLCPGCSHRATYYAVKKAAEGLETIYPTDIGCYTLGFLPPLAMGDFLICMGSSVGTSCGFSKATGKKVIGFIGDSTFFHSGIPGLINAVFNSHDFTLVILDNGTTAMTGHQPHPGVDMAEIGLSGYGRVSIENVVRAIGVPQVTVIEPLKVRQSIEAVRSTIAFKGVSVIISREACTLHAKRIGKQEGRSFTIGDKCRNHRNCIDELACPAFYLDNGKVHIDPGLCTGCAVCAQVCPENAILPLRRH